MIELSPTSARRVQECSAGYLLQYHLLPRTESQEVKDIVRNGSQFHMIGERNFSPEAIAQYLAYLPKEQSLALMKMVDTATSRYYMNQEYEFSSEKKYLYQLSPKWAFRGITDRRVKIKDDVHIIDWKTTANPRPYHDIIQIKGYGFLEHKIEGTPVEKIQLILDYVNANTMTEVDFLEEDVPLYEHYLCRLFEEA
jgi:ATP-dependent exoDNAse (exonuclease V) beta subunit